jgi:thiazole/oxazole-forming peptide maturase SagD family component
MVMITPGNDLPIQVTLGIADEMGALFLFENDMTVIGGADDCERVLEVARLCDGTRTAEAVEATAQAAGMPRELAQTILSTLIEQGVVRQDASASSRADLYEVQRANLLLANFVGAGRLVSTLDVYRPSLDDSPDSLLPYFSAGGRFTLANGEPYTCHGQATTAARAVLRAIGEAIERYHNGSRVRVDAFGTARSLAHEALVFEAVLRQQAPYVAERGWHGFDPEEAHPWVLAHYLGSGEPVYLLADTIYYPVTHRQLGRPKVSEAMVSGSAAHFERDQAVRHGLFEVIERDAVAATWWSQRPVTAIPIELAPEDIRERIAVWSERGREFKLLNLTLDGLPVVLALSEGDRYPFITAGCAAATTFGSAITKAFLESEMMALSWEGNPEPLPVPSANMSALDHGRLYAHPGNEHRLDWLLNAPLAEPREREVTMAELIERFEPIVVDLHAPEAAADLWVVKVLSDKALPITFGYKSEPFGHSRLAELGLAWRSYPGEPHFLA